MNTYIALFRGINVGGKNSLPMKELVVLLEDIGVRKIKTYIQSGNAVFQSTEKNFSQLSERLAAEIKKRHGFEPHVLILGLDAIERAMAENPFPEAEADPSSLHLGFLASTPKSPDLRKLDSLRKESERFHLSDREMASEHLSTSNPSFHRACAKSRAGRRIQMSGSWKAGSR